MDDIDLIRGIDSEFPGPDPAETARARERLMAAVAEAQGPAETGAVPSPAEAAETRRANGATRAPRRVVRRRRWALVACAAAAAVAAALVVPGLFTKTPVGGVQNAAAAALNQAADVAAAQDAMAPPTAGQFMYTKSQSVFESTFAAVDPQDKPSPGAPESSASPGTQANLVFTVLTPVTREAWIAPDGRGRLLETNGQSTFLTPHDEAVWKEAGKPDLDSGRTSDESFGKGGLSFMDLSGLPTDADALRKLIVERKVEGGPAGDAETFTIIGDMLRETYAPPALRAALYRIAATLPGVDLLGTVQDHAGRSGTAVGYTNHGDRNVLIFDPTTAALLGEESVVVDPTVAHEPVPAGTVMSWSVYLASGVVDSTAQRASADQES